MIDLLIIIGYALFVYAAFKVAGKLSKMIDRLYRSNKQSFIHNIPE